MRVVRIGSTLCVFGLGLLLAGCGHSNPGVPTLSVTCDGSLMLAGASSVNVASTAGGTGTTLSFPDPNNPDQTGTLPVQPGRSCVITPVAGADDDDHHPARKAGHGTTH